MNIRNITLGLCALLLIGNGLFAAENNDGLPDPIVARGKGFEIKRSEMENAFIAFKANAAAIGENISEEKRPTLEAQLLEEMIINRILVPKATDEDKANAKKAADAMIDQVRKRSSSEMIFKMRLRALGLTVEEFDKQVREQELRKAVVMRDLASTITIDDAEIKKFYDENPAEFERPERVRASHILVSTVDRETRQPLSSEEKKKKEEQIKKLKTRAEQGEDFAKLAKEFSEDPSSKDRGGEYIFGRGDMVRPFENTAFSLKANQISDVIETQFGYHIIKLHEYMPARKAPLSEASPQIKEHLTAVELRKRLPVYYEKLKKAEDVEILAGKGTDSSAKN